MEKIRSIREAYGVVRLEAQAWELHKEFDHWRADQIDAGEMGLVRAFLAKLSSHVARIGLVLHALKHGCDSPSVRLSTDTMNEAITIGRYFLNNVVALSRDIQSKQRDQLLRVLTDDWNSKTEIHRKLGSHTPAEQLDRRLAHLEGLGLAETQTVGTGGRPSEQWRRKQRTGEFSEETEGSPQPVNIDLPVEGVPSVFPLFSPDSDENDLPRCSACGVSTAQVDDD